MYQNGKIPGFFRFKSPLGNFKTLENQNIVSIPYRWFDKIEGLLIHPLRVEGNWNIQTTLILNSGVNQELSALLAGNKNIPTSTKPKPISGQLFATFAGFYKVFMHG